MVDWQAAFQALTGVAFIVIWFLYRDMKTKVEKSQEDLLNYKTHVAEHYVKNIALEKMSTALFAKLDRIENKIFNIGNNGNQP